MTAPRAIAVADWFVVWARANGDNDLTHLKLQKLLYYAQGWNLALYDRRAFSDEVEAWDQGPVVKDAYHAFKKYGDRTIEPSELGQPTQLGQQLGSLLTRVWDTYGQFSAWKLRNMTHSEKPWADNFHPGVRHLRIPSEQIRDFFADESPIRLADEPSVFEDRRPVVLSSAQSPTLKDILNHARRARP